MFASRLGILLVAHDFPHCPDDLSQLALLADVEALAIGVAAASVIRRAKRSSGGAWFNAAVVRSTALRGER